MTFETVLDQKVAVEIDGHPTTHWLLKNEPLSNAVKGAYKLRMGVELTDGDIEERCDIVASGRSREGDFVRVKLESTLEQLTREMGPWPFVPDSHPIV